ncbi:DUF6247 family protein [Streptomonospora litoralis]|uniref:Uncharacterized protein n=1 Tax=Streptomonospora litoralis TaxID=2498135 RepID=A0A4P6Q3C3_9ACTN|nr:DUF6247 family protein [Streptomonospora litoralis]QBI53389.1 hypothetical protein EKD16_07970 [Streptomonospora litoralis]
MTEQHLPSGLPLIAMPALTPTALRTAVAQLAPARVAEFSDHLEQAAEQAAAQSTLAPLRSFLQYWGEFVAIERIPERAARLRRLEEEARRASDMVTATRLIGEIQQILAEAEREVAT